MEKALTPIKHYTIDGQNPLCGWHKAHVGEPYSVTDKLSLEVCDLCMYVLWRKISHADILEHLPKCRSGISLWSEEENLCVSCELPTVLHENIPEDEQIHWDFRLGYWIGLDPDSFIDA